jgi:endonuclease/exonuclease/phosphatase family metal-dependent hydrolase
VRLASFNIHGGRLGGRAGLRALIEACIELDADILGLQEVDRRQARTGFTDQAAAIARRIGGAHVYAPTRHRVIRGQYGNALVARGTIDDIEKRILPGTGTQQPRSAVMARVSTSEGEVSVAVTHLQHRPKRLRHLPKEAPDQLRALLGWLKERPAPRVLLGDLNLQPPRVEPMLHEAGFEIAATGPAYPVEAPRIQLDYIAVDGLEVSSAAVLAPATNSSDHRPIIADVRFR